MSATTVTVHTLHDFTAAWNRHDIDALMGFMSDDCEFHAAAGTDLRGRSFIGRAAVREGFEMAWQNFPDVSWTESEAFVVGDRGWAECTVRGTRAADGKRLEVRMVDVFTFSGGKIKIKNAFRKERPLV
jgi:ketosteroid isomerase-like protein